MSSFCSSEKACHAGSEAKPPVPAPAEPPAEALPGNDVAESEPLPPMLPLPEPAPDAAATAAADASNSEKPGNDQDDKDRDDKDHDDTK